MLEAFVTVISVSDPAQVLFHKDRPTWCNLYRNHPGLFVWRHAKYFYEGRVDLLPNTYQVLLNQRLGLVKPNLQMY